MNQSNAIAASFPARGARGRDVLWIAATALIYFVTARFSLSFVFEPEGIAAIWPPAGLFLSAILLTRRDLRPYIVAVLCATDFVAELLSGTPPLVSAAYALALSGDAVLSCWLLFRFVGASITFGRVRDVAGWLGLSVLLSNGVMSLAAAAAAMSLPESRSFLASWQLWAASDGVGNLLVTPLIIGWARWVRTRADASGRGRVLEGAALFAGLALLAFALFARLADHRLFALFLPYVVFPFLVWAALRFGGRGVATAMVVLAAIAISFAAAGRVPGFSFAPGALDDVIVVQLFVAITAVPALFLAAVVTERRESDTARLAGEQEFRSLAEAMPQIVWVTRADGWNTYFNQQWVDYTGLTLEESYGHGWNTPFHPDDRQRAWEAWQRATRRDEPYSLECRLRRADGAYRWWLVRGVPLREAGGQILKWFGTCTDIEDIKQTEVSLRESEGRLRDITFSIGDWVWEVDENAVYIYSSVRGSELFGDAIGKTPFDFMPPDEARRVAPMFADCVARRAPIVDLENWNITKSGGRVCLLTNGVPILDAGGTFRGYRGVDRDITNRKRAEEEKARLEAQLRQALKMESVGRLAGGVAHDFNNMLSVILGHAELALGQLDPAQPVYADLEEIRKAATRSADLTRQLLAFARKQTVMPKVLDVNDTVARTLKMLQRLIGEDITLRWQPKADLWPIRIDPSQLDQILANLCVNARDAIAGVGLITIEGGHTTFTEDYCAAHPGSTPGDHVLIAVSDNGRGMDKDTLSHVFEPFFTTKAVGRGTGLGLATVYGIVKQNNGSIEVYSEPNHGTTLRIYLPRHAGAAADGPAEGAPRPAPARVPRGRETILVVEDEAVILALATKMLVRQGYTVLAAGTPREAIRLATEHAGAIHLLMTDVVMPEMNGRALAEHLLSLHPRLKSLFMSGYTADIIAHRGVLEGGVHFIQKPFSIEGLAVKVREALEADAVGGA